jgi:hypothetical protein
MGKEKRGVRKTARTRKNIKIMYLRAKRKFMQEEKIQAVVSNFEAKYREWLKSQEGQESAYDYESSYTEFMRQISNETLQTTTSSDLKSRNSKKKFRPQ